MINWIKNNRLLSIVLLICIGFFTYYIYNAIRWIPYPNSIDYGEGFVMNYAKLWANGTWSWDINTPPYLTMVYGVGFPIILTPLVNMFGYGLWVGRAVSFASALIVCGVVYLIVLELTHKKSYALLTALLPSTQPIFREWSVMARVDMTAVMFDVIGLYLVIKLRDSKWLYLSVVPFVCAVMVKLSAVAGLGAVGIYLLIYHRRELWKFGAYFTIGLALAIAPLMVSSGGTYLNHIITYQNSIAKLHLGTFLFLFNMWIYAFLILLIPSLYYLKKCWSKRELTLVGAFFVIALIIDLLSSFKVGAASMYYFEVILAGCICTSLMMPYIAVYLKRHQLQLTHLTIIGVLLLVSGYYSLQPNIQSPDKQYTESVTEVEGIMSDSEHPIITENPAIALNMGKDLYMEYFIFTNMTRLGYWDETQYVEKYNEQYFDYVVLRVALMDRVRDVYNGRIDGDFTDNALLAIYNNYSLVYETVNKYYPYSLYVYEANTKLTEDNRPIIKNFERQSYNLVWDSSVNEWVWRVK